MNTAAKLSTGGKLSTGPFSASKKSGMKRENPPCTPYKRKARGKENNPSALSPSALSTVYSRARTQACASASAHARRSADATPRGRKSSRSAALRASHKSPSPCRDTKCEMTRWLTAKVASAVRQRFVKSSSMATFKRVSQRVISVA